MVRVISVHHFANQHIQTVEQPTASAVAPPNRLLLALSSHCIEVRDLNDHSEVLFTFPTVDEVTQIVHCLNGDYVATVETKYNRQNRETNFVRVYVNWDNIATMQQSKMTHSGISLGSSECGMVQPMRARIAGRVTPTTNQSELGSLEMIEIPVKRNPQQIQCCQITGNIIIQMNKSITVYTFEVKTHDISRLRFIDFEEVPLTIDLSFYPRDIAICENYIACSSNDTLHMFRILNKRNKEDQSHVERNCEYNFNYSHDDSPIDYKKLLKNERLNIGKEKFTIHLPTIVKENSIIHKYCPFTFCDRDIKAVIKTQLSFEGKPYEIENLIQLKLKPIIVELSQKQVAEEFKCMLLKPLYVSQNLAKQKHNSENNNIFRNSGNHMLHSVVCLITTQQEGYLYQFTDSDLNRNVDNCITVYPFTAPIYKIAMEDYFLHALTETGLETYTLRTCHELCRHLEVIDDENVACPPVEEAVCLMGLRPFLGVEEILLSDNHLVLLANADSSPTHSASSHGSSTAAYWTLYNLELPTARTVFNDISIVANNHRFTSVQTYCHLMSEAHMILRTSLILTKWNFTEGNVSLVTTKKVNNEDLKEAYRTSCALLGDHFVMSSNKQEYVLCVPYYKMALVYPSEVLSRVKKVQEQSNNFITKGLLYYLKVALLDTKYGPDSDKYYISGSKQNFTETIIELFQKHCFDDLPNIVLKSNVLREYSADKLITILNNGMCRTPEAENEKLLALAILYIQRCNTKKAHDILLKEIRSKDLHIILLQNWELLFDQTHILTKHRTASFSELSVLVMSIYPNILSEILVMLVSEKKVLTLHRMLKIFLEYLPASIGSDGTTGSKVLQITLEKYFISYFTKHDSTELTKLTLDRATNEAMKLLVRSYLSQLQIMQLKEKNQKGCEENNVIEENTKKDPFDNNKQPYFEEMNTKNKKETYLFYNYRYEYLDKMPPLQMEITSKLYEACLKKNVSREVIVENKDADNILKKLQAILSSPIICKQVIVEVVAFLDLNENLRGCLSIQSIILNVNEAVTILVDKCPQCLLQFGKDRCTKSHEWKYMIATIQSKIIRLSENVDLKHVCFFYKKILKDVLTHAATSMNLEQLLEVFPQKMNIASLETEKKIDSNKAESLDDALQFSYNSSDELDAFLKNSCVDVKDGTEILNEIQNYDPYITMCKETMHANQIKKLITATGQQLLCTLNL